jgi:ankyrin repeat protein
MTGIAKKKGSKTKGTDAKKATGTQKTASKARTSDTTTSSRVKTKVIDKKNSNDLAFPFDAISEGRLGDVKRFLDAGGDINARPKGALFTLLIDAVQTGKIDLVKSFIAGGADPNGLDALKESPLQHAAELALKELVRVLLENGADPRYRDTRGMTPLHCAACSERIPGVPAWKHLPPPKKADVIRLLLQAGADPEAKDNAARTPLFFLENASNREGLDTLRDWPRSEP